jgi:hypothetical protein
MNRTTFSISLFLVTTVLALSCKETLPVYQEPPKVVECGMSYVAPKSIDYSHLDENAPRNIRLSSPLTKIIVTATNVFDETIQDDALLSGYIEIRHPNKPGVYRKILFSKTDLVNNGQYEPFTNVLTIDPGKNVQIQVFWDYKDSTGTYVFLGLPIESEKSYNAFFYRDHIPAPFIIKASIQLYKRLTPVRSSESEMTLHFYGTIYFGP